MNIHLWRRTMGRGQSSVRTIVSANNGQWDICSRQIISKHIMFDIVVKVLTSRLWIWHLFWWFTFFYFQDYMNAKNIIVNCVCFEKALNRSFISKYVILELSWLLDDNVVVGVFSIYTISVQFLYVAWGNAIHAQPPKCFKASKMLIGGQVARLYRSSRVY